MLNLNVTSKLIDCADVLIGKNIDKSKTNEQGVGTPLIVGASDIYQGRIACKRFVDENTLRQPVIAQKGDIIISTVGTLGKIGIMTIERAVISGHVAAIRPKRGTSRPYLVSVIARLTLDIMPDDEFLTGFSKKLDIEALKNIRFTLPTLLMQDYIICLMTSVISLTMALEADKTDLQDYNRFIDLLTEEHAKLRAHYRKKIEPLTKLQEILSTSNDEELNGILANFNNIQKRISNL